MNYVCSYDSLCCFCVEHALALTSQPESDPEKQFSGAVTYRIELQTKTWFSVDLYCKRMILGCRYLLNDS